MKDEKSHLYHTELENAAEERRRNRMLDRAKDQQESIHVREIFFCGFHLPVILMA